MKFDKWIALLFLLLCIIYGYAAFSYQLLPFERNLAFLPNTLPKSLAILGGIIAIVILVSPKVTGDDGVVLGELNWQQFRQYNIGQAICLILAMTAYAVLLRPIGFVPATVLFIAGSGAILGERKFHWLIIIALIAAFSVWYLVQELLGIFLKPWPWFI